MLLVVCLLAVGTYGLLVRTGKVPLGNAGSKGKVPVPPGTPVVAVQAKKSDFKIYITGLGSVTPVHTVTVKAASTAS